MLGGASADVCGRLVSEELEDEIRKRFVSLCLMRRYLYGKASHVEGILLAWAAVAVVGNDNVLMYLTSASGRRSVVL